MATIDSFEEFLQNKEDREQQKNSDFQKRRQDWISSVDKLFSQIKMWLEKYHSIRIETQDYPRVEDYIGTYNTKILTIYVGIDKIMLIPVGTFIIGAFGRIDITGPRGSMIMIQSNWNRWEFVKRTPFRETWEVNESTFKNAIQELVNA